MSASSHPLATAAGISALNRGGNAVDAAVATAFALAVVEPAMSHLGGQGNAIICMAGSEPVALDFYATAPRDARPDMYRWIPGATQGLYRFHTEGDRNTTGPLSVAVPGAVAGWLYAHERWGRLPLPLILEPAATLAEQGVPLTPRMAGFVAEGRDRLAQFPATRRVWLHPDGSPLAAGEIVTQPQLADTIRLIAEDGLEAFYDGPLAESMVRMVRDGGGILTRDDLLEYPTRRFRVDEPPAVAFGPVRVAAAPVSSAVVLLPLLRLLDLLQVDRHEPLAPAKLHLMIEAMKLTFADRSLYSGDPDFVNVPLAGLLDDAYQEARLQQIDPRRAGSYGPGDPWRFQEAKPDPRLFTPTPEGRIAGGQDAHTTHHSHVDRWGNMVSMTQSLGDAFGSAVMVPDHGFFLNNAMKLFDPRPGRANSIAPHKRPATAPCPTMAFLGPNPVLALGSPSGTRILNAIAQVLVHVFRHGLSLQYAVNLPRLHWSGDELEIESDLPAAAQEDLASRGHRLERRSARSPWFGAVQAVARDPASALCQGAADPRRQGAVSGTTMLDEFWSEHGH
ncbi:MAG TPA: gamma-glutamyltransferase [Bacillota bacterium]